MRTFAFGAAGGGGAAMRFAAPCGAGASAPAVAVAVPVSGAACAVDGPGAAVTESSPAKVPPTRRAATAVETALRRGRRDGW
ncbi:hypothetical protein GCM10018791_60650 [Streptomyces zaomyceticus]|nr:hypothetical protein GCM10018791_60650 [Streptomyces zaomyceticus]